MDYVYVIAIVINILRMNIGRFISNDLSLALTIITLKYLAEKSLPRKLMIKINRIFYYLLHKVNQLPVASHRIITR